MGNFRKKDPRTGFSVVLESVLTPREQYLLDREAVLYGSVRYADLVNRLSRNEPLSLPAVCYFLQDSVASFLLVYANLRIPVALNEIVDEIPLVCLGGEVVSVGSFGLYRNHEEIP